MKRLPSRFGADGGGRDEHRSPGTGDEIGGGFKACVAKKHCRDMIAVHPFPGVLMPGAASLTPAI